MLRRNYHICSTVECVGTGGINRKCIACCCLKINLGTRTSANPVFLLSLYTVGIINKVKVIDKSVGILGDFEHPLRLYFVNNFTSAAFANTVYNLFVCKYAFTGSTPVYIHFFFIGKAVFEELNKNPLSPLVIIRVSCIYLSAPVKGNAERLNLLFKAGNIFLCNDFGMNMVFNCIVFCRKSECVPTDWIKNIVALKSSLTSNRIKRRIRTRMSNVKSLSRRIRKFYKGIEFFFIRVRIGVENTFILPYFLPFLFNCFMIVFQFNPSD